MSRGDTDELALVLFRCRGLDLALPSLQILEMRLPSPDDAGSVAHFLGLPEAESGSPAPPQRSLVIAHPGGCLGIRVEQPVVQRGVLPGAIRPLPGALASRQRYPWVRGIVRLSGPDGIRLAILLDGARIAPGAHVPVRVQDTGLHLHGPGP